MQMRDGAVWGGYPGVTAPLLPPAPSPPSQPTPEGTLVTPAPPETATPHNGLDELAPSRAGKFMHLLANFGTFNFFLNFFLHKTASSVPRGGIGNGHFIYSCSGTPAEQCHSFLCMGMLRSPSAGAAVLLHTEYFDILVFWYSHLWSGFFRAPDTNLTPLPLKWAAFHPPLLLFALLRGLST